MIDLKRAIDIVGNMLVSHKDLTSDESAALQWSLRTMQERLTGRLMKNVSN